MAKKMRKEKMSDNKRSSSQLKTKTKTQYIKANTRKKSTTGKKKPKRVVRNNKEIIHRKTRKKRKRQKQLNKLLKQLALTIGISSIVFSTISYFTIRVAKIEGYAMTATLTNNDRVVISKLGKIKRFSLVYFKHPVTKEKTIRRIIGMPGDELFYKNDQLFINNQLTPERFLEKATAEARQSGYMLTQDFSLKQIINETYIPEAKYFVMGDNRSFSSDSRDYGVISKENIIGIVEMRIFPLHTATDF